MLGRKQPSDRMASFSFSNQNSGADLEGVPLVRASSYLCRDRGAPLYFCRNRAPDCVWTPRRRRFSS